MEDAVIVRSTIDLGRNLGLGVVAEGVEDPEVLEELRRLGCDVAQGYLMSRPIPGDELIAGWASSRLGQRRLTDGPAPLAPPGQ